MLIAIFLCHRDVDILLHKEGKSMQSCVWVQTIFVQDGIGRWASCGNPTALREVGDCFSHTSSSRCHFARLAFNESCSNSWGPVRIKHHIQQVDANEPHGHLPSYLHSGLVIGGACTTESVGNFLNLQNCFGEAFSRSLWLFCKRGSRVKINRNVILGNLDMWLEEMWAAVSCGVEQIRQNGMCGKCIWSLIISFWK